MEDADMDRVLGRMEAALDRIEAALAAGTGRDGGEAERLRDSNARLRAAVGGAIARIDGLLLQVEGDAGR
jgi:hypothetical protein